MNEICCQVDYSELAAVWGLPRDSLEAMSQMLENYVYEKDALIRMSGHWKTNEALPMEYIDALNNAKNANVALLSKRQLVLALADQTIHARGKSDTAKIYSLISKRILGITPTPGTNMLGSFAHITGGYDASYYGYMYSLVFAADMYETRFKDNIFDPKTGLDYRNIILKPGGSKDFLLVLKEFLGRDCKPDAFYRSKGLQV